MKLYIYVFGPLRATVVNISLWFEFPKLPLPVTTTTTTTTTTLYFTP